MVGQFVLVRLPELDVMVVGGDEPLVDPPAFQVGEAGLPHDVPVGFSEAAIR